MSNPIFGAGVACIIAAIVGGGLKAFGIEIPVLNSVRRQILLAAFGILLVLSQVVGSGHRTPPLPITTAAPATPAPPPRTLTSTPVDNQIGPIWVASIKHHKYSEGRYFDFDAGSLDRLLGSKDWGDKMFLVFRERDKHTQRAVLWRRPSNGGPGTGDAHGRYLGDEGRPYWKEGDKFFVILPSLGAWKDGVE